MIITLKGADFSQSNIGTLSSWRISRSLGTGATYEGVTSVDKGAAFSATVTLAEGYEVGTAGVTVTMGGTVLSGAHSISGNVITITIAEVTGNVLIKVPTVNTSTGEEEEPDVTQYTITYKYQSSGIDIKASTTEKVAHGTVKTFSTSKAPNINGYTVSSVTPTSATITSDITVIYNYNVNGAIGDTIALGTVLDKKWIKNEDGTIQTLNNWKSTDFITIPEDAIAVSTEDITAFRNSSAVTTPFAFYDSDQTYISGVGLDIIPIGTTGVTTAAVGAWRNSIMNFPIPENAAYIRICWTTDAYRHMTYEHSTSLTEPIVNWVK
jgi:hypothetical protein